MLIGLTGSFAAGKDTVARYLTQKGFLAVSLSDLIRNELKARGLPITRENLIICGNDVRKNFGADEWARRAFSKAEASGAKKILLISIRNPREADYLKKVPGFKLWFVDAPIQTRYNRARNRARSDDFSSLDDFLAREKQENSPTPYNQQLSKVAELADAEIINDKSLSELYRIIDELLEEETYNLNLEPAHVAE